ncbi:polyketide synthase [Streptomyces sp. CG1]|uniref:beta-ketoacyl [acyl carrier protein] synthase domain-containing protein n=1 Tax=Streptomyces sp. CG1 TaxID=1287523 RepID=UPI0034E2E3A1
MSSLTDPLPDDRGTDPEPVAIVGISALYPQAQGVDAFWSLMLEPAPGCACTSAHPAAGLDPESVDVSRYGIPPAQAGSMAAMQKLMLEAARHCLTDAGYAERPLPSDRTDVLAGVCFGLDRQYANARRVEATRYADELRASAEESDFADTRGAAAAAGEELAAVMRRTLGESPHDRVGEMASTIPARIAGVFGLRGRTMAVESADLTSYALLAHAVSALRCGGSDAVLVLAGQADEGPLPGRALAAKGLGADCVHPLEEEGQGYPLGEGVGAVLLKRLSTAVHDGDRIYALVRGCALGHDPRPGTFRYSVSPLLHERTARAADRTLSQRGCAPQYVECSGTGVAGVTAAELGALNGLLPQSTLGSVAVGSVRDRLGHTFANSGLASLTKVALALYHRRLPPHWAPRGSRPLDLAGSVFHTLPEARPWPAGIGGGPRRAVLGGTSLTGSVAHLVVEEYDASRARHGAVQPPQAAAAEPIAVVAYGGAFAGSPDPHSLWQTFISGRDRFAPLPREVLERRLHHAPGALSLSHTYTDLGAWMAPPREPPDGVPVTPARWAAMDPAQRLTLTVAAQFLSRRSSEGLRGGPGPVLAGHGIVAVGSNLCLTRERLLNAALCADDLEAAVEELAALAELPSQERKTLAAQARSRCAGQVPPLGPADPDGCLASGVAAVLANEYRLAAVPMAVEAACASSMAALDVAITALRSGAAEFALAGGVELPCNPRDMILCSALGLLSHSRITPFDRSADGFTPGDGCGLFLLKRLRDAVRDGDIVHAVLCGIGASNDAKSLIAPDTEGQARAIRDAFGQVGFDPGAVDYLEAHGTGTRVGDRVEVAATAATYGTPRRRQPLHIGSAKSFLGHTFAAAGAAGLLRVLLAIRAGTLPPHTNLDTPEPSLDLDAIPAMVPDRPVEWHTRPGHPRRAGVSSFGTGGINYHLLVEEHLDGSG